MRVWDVAPEKLCRNHLLGEHREIHAIWSVLTNNKRGYSRHPEVLRWKKRLGALYKRHEEVASEMRRRGHRHNSPLDPRHAVGSRVQSKFIDTPEEQLIILRRKQCGCRI